MVQHTIELDSGTLLIDSGEAMANPKKLFAVFAVSNPVKMEAQIASAFPDAHFKIKSDEWLLVGESTMTTMEVSQKLLLLNDPEISADQFPGNAVVVSVSNYFGRATADTWEWITSKMGGSDGVAG